jgi:leucine-rich repeat kinase 1
VLFSTWDLAGQEVYYATHQCFLSRNTLYLAAWNMKGGEKEIKALRPWLLNIQARAPYSPVIIVGTHLDKLLPGEAPELRGRYRQLIEKIYMQPGGGYPEICDVIEVSAVTKEGWC